MDFLNQFEWKRGPQKVYDFGIKLVNMQSNSSNSNFKGIWLGIFDPMTNISSILGRKSLFGHVLNVSGEIDNRLKKGLRMSDQLFIFDINLSIVRKLIKSETSDEGIGSFARSDERTLLIRNFLIRTSQSNKVVISFNFECFPV
uniref:Uncharacterized protein n=1 Tax=Romanomermis culicivorax TaxID=13658 RepID=A0A915HRS4_ROMCU